MFCRTERTVLKPQSAPIQWGSPAAAVRTFHTYHLSAWTKKGHWLTNILRRRKAERGARTENQMPNPTQQGTTGWKWVLLTQYRRFVPKVKEAWTLGYCKEQYCTACRKKKKNTQIIQFLRRHLKKDLISDLCLQESRTRKHKLRGVLSLPVSARVLASTANRFVAVWARCRPAFSTLCQLYQSEPRCFTTGLEKDSHCSLAMLGHGCWEISMANSLLLNSCLEAGKILQSLPFSGFHHPALLLWKHIKFLPRFSRIDRTSLEIVLNPSDFANPFFSFISIKK